jgi:pyrroline-5-carboxylate reductase
MTYGIIGVGAIAAAIVTGLCESGSDAPSIVLSPRNADRAADLAARFPTVRVARSNQEVIDGSAVVLLCIRPQDAHGVSEAAARRQVAATFAGLAAQLHDQEPAFANLARDHATRGGINEQFLGVLQQARVFDAVDLGLSRVLERLTKA